MVLLLKWLQVSRKVEDSINCQFALQERPIETFYSTVNFWVFSVLPL